MKRYPPLAGAGGGQLRLIIEVDRYAHFLDEVILKDKIREKALKEAGYEVIRFTDTQVLKDIQSVIAKLRKILKNLKDRMWVNLRTSTPSPRQRGTS